MPGYVVHLDAAVECAHRAAATPLLVSFRVRVAGKGAALRPMPYFVSGCPHNVGSSPSPCLVATWTNAATRVTSFGQPLVLDDSDSTSVPNSTPLTVRSTQTRVRAV